MGQTRLLLCRLTIYRVTRSLTMCRYIILSSECSAQMGSEQAGDYSSSLRNNAFSTIEGEGDTMTTAASGLDDLEHRDREIAANRSAVSSTG